MRRDTVRLCQVVFQEFSGCIQDSVNKMFRWTFPPFGDFANRLVLLTESHQSIQGCDGGSSQGPKYHQI